MTIRTSSTMINPTFLSSAWASLLNTRLVAPLLGAQAPHLVFSRHLTLNIPIMELLLIPWCVQPRDKSRHSDSRTCASHCYSDPRLDFACHVIHNCLLIYYRTNITGLLWPIYLSVSTRLQTVRAQFGFYS